MVTRNVGIKRIDMKVTAGTYILAFALASLFAAGMLGGCWILNQSPLPPCGGGLKMLVLPPTVVWIVVFGLVILERTTGRRRAFRIGKET